MDYRKTQQTLSVILGGGRGSRLYPLTKERAKPAVPLGGKYRLIDVPISNCLNSGLNHIYVLTQFQSASLHRHVKDAYKFDRFSKGFVEILAAEQTPDSEQWYQGTADAVRRNLIHFGRDWHEMLILSGDQLYRMDFQQLLAQHRRKGADVSIAVLPVKASDASRMGVVQVDKTGRVIGFQEKPQQEQLKGLETSPSLYREFAIDAPDRPYLASMGIYVYNKNALDEQLSHTSAVDFGKDVFPKSLESYRVQAFPFDGYWEDIGTVHSFHEANLQMASPNPPFNFNNDAGMVYTNVRTLPPTGVGKLATENSLITEGCRVGEATLKSCVLGIRSIVGNNVRLSRAMMMGADFFETDEQLRQNVEIGRPNIGIGDNVIIEDAIIDKNVRIGSDVIIRNPASVDPVETDMYAVRDGIICLVKNAIIPSGTRIGR